MRASTTIQQHLDEGWRSVAMGQLAQARTSAEEALALQADHPEAHTLMGFLAWQAGDPEAAVAHFDAALDRDPNTFEALLYSAQTLAEDPARVYETLQRVDRALKLVPPQSVEHNDALLVQIEALAACGKERQAKARLSELARRPPRAPEQRLLLARLALRLGEVSLAKTELTALAHARPPVIEAVHMLGRRALALGQTREALAHFARVRELDLAAEPPDLPGPDALRRLATQAIEEIQEPEIVSLLIDAEVVVREYPPLEVLAAGEDPWVEVLISGPPDPSATLTEGLAPPGGPRGGEITSSTPDGEIPPAYFLFIYRRNLAQELSGRDQAADRAALQNLILTALERYVDAIDDGD